MDAESVKTALELAKSAGTAAGISIPFTGIVKRMLGPAADEIAEMWRDQVRVYRYGRQIKLLEKAEKMAADAGFTPQPVPPKILFPLLEGASFEDNEDLHTMWAALLANAADQASIHPGFAGTLKQLTPLEAQVLSGIHDILEPLKGDRSPFTLEDMTSLIGGILELHPGRVDYVLRNLALENLERLALIRNSPKTLDGNWTFTLSTFGRAFIIACRPPKPKNG